LLFSGHLTKIYTVCGKNVGENVGIDCLSSKKDMAVVVGETEQPQQNQPKQQQQQQQPQQQQLSTAGNRSIESSRIVCEERRLPQTSLNGRPEVPWVWSEVKNKRTQTFLNGRPGARWVLYGMGCKWVER